MGPTLFTIFVLALSFNGAISVLRSCSNVELSFPLTGNSTGADEYLSADSAPTRRFCTISGIQDVGQNEVYCIDSAHGRRLPNNWPTGGSRDFFFSKTDPLRGLVYVTDRSRGIIYVCTTSPTNTISLRCAIATKGRTQPKGLELMPPDMDGLAWIETAGRGVFVLGSTLETPNQASPKQLLLGEYAAISFDMKPSFNQDSSSGSNLVLYAVANNFTVYAVRLARKGQSVDIIGDVVVAGKLRLPDNDTFFAQPLAPVVSIAVYDRTLYYATSGSLFRASLVPRQTEGFDQSSSIRNVNVLSKASPTELHSLTFDGRDRRNRPRIARISQSCRSRLDVSGVPCNVDSDTKKACERNGGICLAKRNEDDSVTESCDCPIDYAKDDKAVCQRWRTPYFVLATRNGIQRYEIPTYSQDAYGAYPTMTMPKDRPAIATDDAFFQIQEVDDYNDVTFGKTTGDAFVYQKFHKKIQHFTSNEEINVLLRNEPAAHFMQYEPRSKKLYWLDDARNMIVVMDPYSGKPLTRAIFWHKDLVAFYLDSQFGVLVTVLVGPAFAYQNNGFVRHSTLSFVRCNLGGSGCSNGAAEVPMDERNTSIITAYDSASHKLYVLRDREFPSTQLTLTSVDLNNWDKMPDTVRLSVTPSFKALVLPDSPLPLFSVFNDRVYFVVPQNSGSKTYINMFAGAIYRRTNPSGSMPDAQADIQGPYRMPIENPVGTQIVEFNVGYLYNDSPPQLGSQLNCSRINPPCNANSEICVNNTCLCSPDASDMSGCRRPINLVEGFTSVQGNYSWNHPLKASDCFIWDVNCVSALRRMCNGVSDASMAPQTDPTKPKFDDEDLRMCVLAGFQLKSLKKSATFSVTSDCEVNQDDLCNNKTAKDCLDNADESATLCIALRRLPGLCAGAIPIRQCFLTPDSLPPTTRNWFFQGRTGGPPPQLNTDSPQCIVDNSRAQKFRCVCPSWAMISDDLTRCIPNNPCLDTETNTDHCAPNGKCRYSEYARRDFVCDCNPGFISPPGRADACMDPLDSVSSNRSNICYQRIEICGQRNGAGVCVPGTGADPTSFKCRCNPGFELSTNGMDCVSTRTGPFRPSVQTPVLANRGQGSENKNNLCYSDPKLCGQDQNAGSCVILSPNRFYCRCNLGYDATQDGRNCVKSRPVDDKAYNDIKRVLFEQSKTNGSETTITRSAFSVAFSDAFRPGTVTTQETNRYKVDSCLLATPLLVADETDVVEYTGTSRSRRRSVLVESPNQIIGVAANRLLGIGYVLAIKKAEAQLEIGAFVLHNNGVAANITTSNRDVEFFRVPYIGDPRDMSIAPSQFSLDAQVSPNLLAYTTRNGRSLVTCSSFISPPLEHQVVHNHFTEKADEHQPPLFGGLDCITLVRKFDPLFTGISMASRQRTLLWTDMPQDIDFSRRDIPAVSEIAVPEIFSLEYSDDDPAIYERNAVKRRQAIREFWLAKSAGAPGQQLVMAYDAINDRVTWIHGFEYVPDETPDMKDYNVYGIIVMSHDYIQEQLSSKVFAELVVPKGSTAVQAIYSPRTKLSISNGVAALTLPDIEQIWMFALPTEDTRIYPVVTKVPKIVAASFPASTPDSYASTSSGCDHCFGVCLSGSQETICVCPEDNSPHSSCMPLHIAANSYPWHDPRHYAHKAAVAAIVIIIVLILIGVIAAALAFVVRACGGFSQTVDRVRSYVAPRRSREDVRPLSDSLAEGGQAESPEETKKRGFHMPNVFHQNPSGYVSFDRSSENVSLN